jgi:hypothetical protein
MGQLTALFLTLAIEVPLVVLLAALWRRSDRPSLTTVAAVAAAASLVTHPFAWYFNGMLGGFVSFAYRAAFIEASVIVAEAMILGTVARLHWRAAWTASLLANLSSFGTGLVWSYYLR